MIMAGTHDRYLVALSIAIAMFASFTSLSLAGRVRASVGWMRRVWVTTAALALGGGIWSMHFVAMLAFSMPGVGTSYDLSLTVSSLAIALLFTSAGFAVMDRSTASRGRVLIAGLLMGFGIAAMHYVGMAAMRMPATLSYDPIWVLISIVIAIGAAIAALWLFARDHKARHRFLAAAIMGVAIAGMHFAGMMAAVFTSVRSGQMHRAAASVGQSYLAALIGAVTVLILLMALGAARLERVFDAIARRERQSALRLRIADVLRGNDANQALYEVAALMGEHFGVSRTGYGQLDPVEDQFDYDVCWTDGNVPPLLGRFPAAAFGVKIVAELAAGKTIVVDDLLEAELSDETRTRDTAREVDTRSILVVPFVRDGRLRTIVYLNDRNPRRWQGEEVGFMEELAERTRLFIERAAVENQLRELNTTLEERVEARTLELRQAQEALLQSQKMEAVGQLVSGLAHDFNNVLGAVVGAFDVLRRRADDPERVKRFAEAGLQAAERGAKLTAQLLAFSRSQRIQLQPLYVCDVIEAMRDMLARTLGPMIIIDFQLNSAPVPVLADSTQVEMMILNLAINARDAMPDGGKLRISTAVRRLTGNQEAPDGEYVEIAVCDTGIGMDETTLRRAMEPFFTTKPVGRGTGLGLSQIYGSARQTGGTVQIESKPGLGTTVRVLFPRTDLQPIIVQPTSDRAPALLRFAATILLVDDDRDLRSVVAASLETQGFRVIEAQDGPSALAALADELPDIAVLDFAMPGMNGAELALQIIDRWPALPVVFASGFADTDAIERAVGAHATILRKPYRVDELLHALHSSLRELAMATTPAEII